MLQLLHKLCSVHAPSGEESAMKNFLLSYIQEQQHGWKSTPEIFHGDAFQDCIILKFGNPTTAIFAHMDSIGFTVRYQNQLVPIGSPMVENGTVLVGEDALGPISCTVKLDSEDRAYANYPRPINRGTSLVFDCNFRETKDTVQSCYLDNRLGVYSALKVAKTLTNGIIAFSCWEEHGGGSVPYLAKFIFEKWGVRQALVSDITWVTDGVLSGEGVAISLRDKNIPRKAYLDKITKLAVASGIPFQLEVEGSGSSDGRELQTSPYPFDWCFIGAPEENVHSPDEMVDKKDIDAMIKMYEWLMQKL